MRESKACILIVDRAPDMRRLVRRPMQSEGFNAIDAGDSEFGLPVLLLSERGSEDDKVTLLCMLIAFGFSLFVAISLGFLSATVAGFVGLFPAVCWAWSAPPWTIPPERMKANLSVYLPQNITDFGLEPLPSPVQSG